MTDIDVLVRGARIIDGSGNPWFYGDVALRDDRIHSVVPPGSIPRSQAGETIDAEGMVICPGFIDIQSHSIIPLMQDGRGLSKITQGVTTEIMGESWTPAPAGGRLDEPLPNRSGDERLAPWQERARSWTRFRHWLEAVAEHGVSPNIGSFLGGGTLREFSKGMEMGAASPAELETMRRVMAEAMEDGAFGVAYALIYPPEAYVATDELVAVCEVVHRYGGVYITHIRSEGDELLEGIDEAIEIGRRAGVPVEIYHLKAAGQGNWGKMPAVIARIHEARTQGLDVTADMYPYAASGTGLDSLLPPWVSAEGKFFENLQNPDVLARIRQEVLNPSGNWEAMGRQTGPDRIMPLEFRQPENRGYAGKRLAEIAAMRGQDWFDTVIDLLRSEGHRIGTVYFSMDEANLANEIRQPWMKIATDAGGIDPAVAAERGPVHPRAYGTYPRVLRKYVREEGVISLEDAIRKMTSAVADRVGLRDRGSLRAGCYADVAIFDPETVGDRATFENPHQLSVGIRDVWVNGKRVIAAGDHTGALPGHVVHGPGYTRA